MITEQANEIIEAVIDEFDLYENDPLILEITNLLEELEELLDDRSL